MEADDLLCSHNARPQKDRREVTKAALLARRTRTMKLCSSDARSKGSLGHSSASDEHLLSVRVS